jgi:hypothetical protein
MKLTKRQILKMKNLIEQDQSEIPFSEGNASSDFSSSTPQGTTDSPTLDPITAFKLWQIYLERVNPLLKIVHAPTVQSLIVSTTADIEKAPLDQQALIYSIFGVAVSALRSDEIASMLGAGKQRDEFLEHFLTAVSVSLAHFGSFARHNMTVLQALLHNSVRFYGSLTIWAMKTTDCQDYADEPMQETRCMGPVRCTGPNRYEPGLSS